MNISLVSIFTCSTFHSEEYQSPVLRKSLSETGNVSGLAQITSKQKFFQKINKKSANTPNRFPVDHRLGLDNILLRLSLICTGSKLYNGVKKIFTFFLIAYFLDVCLTSVFQKKQTTEILIKDNTSTCKMQFLINWLNVKG